MTQADPATAGSQHAETEVAGLGCVLGDNPR